MSGYQSEVSKLLPSFNKFKELWEEVKTGYNLKTFSCIFAHPYGLVPFCLSDTIDDYLLPQDPSMKVAEFMATNPVLTEIEAQITHYQVISLYQLLPSELM